MWLINTTSMKLESFQEPREPYAILSHTWGSDAEEVHFEEFRHGQGRQKEGYKKIRMCCAQAKQDGLSYAWVDTCCIDKSSSAELSESINSMFRWYKESKICYIYLSDVSLERDRLFMPNNGLNALKNSRWFTRGWTLQELIAPGQAIFYSHEWITIGLKTDLAAVLHEITGIDVAILAANKDFSECSIAQRMSWASSRQTTRIEDQAYSLLGLFNVNMPLLYGEGTDAFLRLQRKIIKHSDDETIFAWDHVPTQGSGLLAPNASHFAYGATVSRTQFHGERSHYFPTNKGLSLECLMQPFEMNTYIVPINCSREQNSRCGVFTSNIAIFLCRTANDDQFRRIPCKGRSLHDLHDWDRKKARVRTVFVPSDSKGLNLSPHGSLPLVSMRSQFETWHFERVVEDEPQNEDVLGKTDQVPCNNPKHRRPKRTLQLAPCFPHRSEQVQFSIHDLEKGVFLAFKSSPRPSAPYTMCLQFGFDFDFNVICVQYKDTFQIPAHALDDQSQLSWYKFYRWITSYLAHHMQSHRSIYLYKCMWDDLAYWNMWNLDLASLDFINTSLVPVAFTTAVSVCRKPWSAALKMSRHDPGPKLLHVRPWLCAFNEVTYKSLDGVQFELQIKQKRQHANEPGSRICVECVAMWSMSTLYLLAFCGIFYVSYDPKDMPVLTVALGQLKVLSSLLSYGDWLYIGRNIITFYVTETVITGFQLFMIWTLALPPVLYLLGTAILFPFLFVHYTLIFLSIYSKGQVFYGFLLGVIWATAWDVLSFATFTVNRYRQSSN